MTLYDVNFIKHFYRTEPDEELHNKLVFTESKWEREAIELELKRRCEENGNSNEML
ncbi:hypothetical protein J2736_006744 [Paenibacillus qinlingensis]|uniref:Uncharacterized protein n=1 Tax=Paenibacillus qinlingensis TaxID=1837343 RepID=A0ABU1P8F8_9BACL|nr:hypothetical protein [Paenibacillus qinlingensis]